MRLIVCILVLVAAALDAKFGQTGKTIWVVGLATGGLLAISAIVDLLLPEQPRREDAKHDEAGH
jgi:hypothetical protein